MERTELLFLEAVKASLKNEYVLWKEPLTLHEWQRIFYLAESHHVLPLVYEAVFRCETAKKATEKSYRELFQLYKRKTLNLVMLQTMKTQDFLELVEFLQEKGTIGFVAPSFGCNIEPYRTCFDAAQKEWKRQGYKIWLGSNCYAGDGIGISNTPKACGEEFVQAWESGENDCLISCGGGELMCEILDYVDFERVKKHKAKWFMGYSDNTNLTFLLPTLCDTAAIYGPCAPAFGMREWHPALKDAWGLLSGRITEVHGYPLWERESLKDEEHPLEPYNVTEEKKLVIYDETGRRIDGEKMTFRGRLIGGCLDCLDTLVGTRFDRVAALNPMGIRRALWQLKEAGWFRHVKGFLIGRPLCFGEEFLGLDQYEAVYGVLGEYHVPVVMDVDLGHLPPSMPVISGGMAEVSLDPSGNGTEIGIKYL